VLPDSYLRAAIPPIKMRDQGIKRLGHVPVAKVPWGHFFKKHGAAATLARPRHCRGAPPARFLNANSHWWAVDNLVLKFEKP
jgi:hypothetical protein